MNSYLDESEFGERDDSPPGRPTTAQIIDLERAQIGHDLHDMLLPLIFAASANLSSILDKVSSSASLSSPDPGIDPATLERIAKSNDWLKQALNVGRNLLTQIYPPELDQLSWLVAAKDVAARICGDTCEVVWTVDPASPVGDPNWDRDLAAAAYRILVESLRNATRHGKAETVSIRCMPDCLLIVDDGEGFDPSKVDSNRFGIRSMKGRAKLVGQSLTIDSEPGGPTQIRMSF